MSTDEGRRPRSRGAPSKEQPRLEMKPTTTTAKLLLIEYLRGGSRLLSPWIPTAEERERAFLGGASLPRAATTLAASPG